MIIYMKKSYKKRSRKRSTKKRARRRTKKAGDYSELAKMVMDTKIQKKLENYDRNTYRQLGLTDSEKKKLDEMFKQKKIDKAQKELAKRTLGIDSLNADEFEKYIQHKRGITKQKFPNQQHGMKYARLYNPATRAKRLRSVINKKKELENKAAQIKKPNDLLKQLEEIDEKSKGKGTKRKREGGKRKRKTRRRRRRRS